MKRKLSLILGCAAALSLSACNAPNFKENTQTFDFPSEQNFVSDYLSLMEYNYKLNVNETKAIQIDSIPSTYKTTDIEFISKSQSVVSVSETGVLKGLSKGKGVVEVKTSDGKYDYLLNVFVGETKTVTAALPIIDTVAESLTLKAAPTKVCQNEFIDAIKYTNGKLQNRTAYTEAIVIDTENAYFKVTSDDLNVKAENGSVEKTSGTWIFYTDEYYVTYLFHRTGAAKRYCELKTQAYIGQPRVQAVYHILDMFFVAGSGIATSTLEDCTGLEDLTDTIRDCASNNYTNVKQSYASTNNSDLFASIEMSFTDQKFGQGDEQSGFRAGDKYDAVQKLDYFYSEDALLGLNIDVKYDYKVGDQPWTYDFKRSETYDLDPELEYPEVDTVNGGFVGYAQVDSLYDL